MTAGEQGLTGLVADCVEAMRDSDPRGAAREVLDRAVTDGSLRGGVESAAGLNILYRSSDLTVLNVIWPPNMFLMPHDHRMWAAIGIYGGREDNTFYRRSGDALVTSGGKELTDGTVLLLGQEVINAVHNARGAALRPRCRPAPVRSGGTSGPRRPGLKVGPFRHQRAPRG